MGFVPRDFEVPELLEHDRFRLRPLTIHVTVRRRVEERWPFTRVAYPGRELSPPTASGTAGEER